MKVYNRAARFLSGLLLVACAFSCVTQDLRNGSGVCEVHGVVMRNATIPLVVGWVDHFDAEYSKAGRELFPHVPPEGSAAKWRRERLYICDECVRAREQWMAHAAGKN